MKIKTIPISTIERATYNPRVELKPGDAEYEHLRKSIEEFGLVDPLIWNERTGRLVGGHQRLTVLENQGEKKVQVSVVDLEESREKALNIALNKIAGQWDMPILKDLLIEIDTGEFDMDITGFSEQELEDLMTEYYVDPDITDPPAGEVPKKPRTKPGDLYVLGEHRLVCGDALDPEAQNLLMGGGVADMVFTDPPYNVDYGSSKNPRHKIRKIENDSQTTDEWRSFCGELAAILKNLCAGDIYVWGAPGPDGMRQRLALIDCGAHWSATIVWKKDQLVLSPAKYQRMYEPCFYGWFHKSSYRADRKQTEVWQFDRPKSSELHPTMKPVALCAYALENSSKPGATVLDLFAGAGSTMMAAEQTGRKCLSMEVDPGYCDVIVKRWEDFTGQKAERVRG